MALRLWRRSFSMSSLQYAACYDFVERHPLYVEGVVEGSSDVMEQYRSFRHEIGDACTEAVNVEPRRCTDIDQLVLTLLCLFCIGNWLHSPFPGREELHVVGIGERLVESPDAENPVRLPCVRGNLTGLFLRGSNDDGVFRHGVRCGGIPFFLRIDVLSVGYGKY